MPLNYSEERSSITTAASPCPSTPALGTGSSCYECKEAMLQEALDVFTATAAGESVTTDDALWDMTTDEVDALLCRPALERLTSSSWRLDPVHAATVVDNDNGNGGDYNSIDNDRDEITNRAESGANTTAVVAAQQLQQPANGMKLPPAGNQIFFGWCEEVRPLFFAMTVCGYR